MNKYIARAAGRVAPRTMENIKTLNTLDRDYENGPARFVSYERELRRLRREIDELRRDNRRVAELYDIVFEWAKSHAAEGDDVFDATSTGADRQVLAREDTGRSESGTEMWSETSARHARPGASIDFDDTALAASTITDDAIDDEADEVLVDGTDSDREG